MSGLDSNFNANFTPSASPIGGIQDKYSNLESGYAGAIAGQTGVPQLTTKYNDQFGVPKLQQTAQQQQEQYDTLGNQISTMPKSIAQASQESILTQGQKDLAVQARSAPLLQAQGQTGQNLSRTQQALGTAQSNAGQMTAAEMAQQTKELQPWTQKFSDEAIIAAQEMSGWSTSSANELNVLLANQSAGIQQSEAQKQRMHELSVHEKDFENNLKLNTQQAGIAKDAYTYSHPDPLGLGL